MNWSIISVKRLKEYKARKESLSGLSEEIEVLKDKFTSVRSLVPDKISDGSGKTAFNDFLINNISARCELSFNKRIVEREIKLTEKGLSVLSSEERHILDLFFITCTKDHIYRLCDELHISTSELYRRKDEALRKFTIACYGIVDV